MNPSDLSAIPLDPRRTPHRRFRLEHETRPTDARPRARTALPLGLFGMLALVAVLEGAVERGGPRFQDPVSYSWSFSARAAGEWAPGADVLCLGDSLVKHGLAPAVIEDVTGRRAVNLAVAAGPSPVTEALLRRALDAGARPSALVFDLKPGLLAGGPRYPLRYWPEALNLPGLIALVRQSGGGSFAAELALSAAIPSFRHRHEIRGDLSAALRGESGPFLAINAVCRRNWEVNAGANIATPRPGYTGVVSEAQHEKYLSRNFFAHRVYAEYARRVVALAAGRGIKTYLLIPPEVPRLHERRTVTGAGEKYSAFVRSLQALRPALTVIDARDSGYPASVFVDPIHLDARGAVAFSADVAAVLRRDLDDPHTPLPSKRWLRLPPFRDRPLPEGLEDVEHSRERLGIKIPR